MNLSVIGAGSWGTALAIVLAPRFARVRLWAHNPKNLADFQVSRQNSLYLPGFNLPENVELTGCLEEAVHAANYVLLVVPSQFLRGVVRQIVPTLEGSELFVSATKGIETSTLSRMSVVITEEVGLRFQPRVAVLSGPTFAKEIVRGEPAAVVVASADPELACAVQRQFSGPALRLYTNDDPTGVETGAALKNVIAIAAGIVQGLGLGNNTLA
ncbi:MAG: NAD(P)H-dependent glycerol-3-phosphate dehydrogenase, partial [Bryobacteraceae bacterium]|nr:NAD(P)H-dependent glycerol-3-phosphate dehydrogenase [Bryobacteraceae bacterium]